MKKIEGSPKNLKQLLQNTKYSIHYYQREYMWQRKHIEELIDDLTSEFLDNYKPGDSRPAVADYGAYFMGSIVLAGRENAIIDGQQRFSSLTLLLMYLNNRLKKIGQSYNMIETMIFSESFGTKSFNINVDDRQECMEAIFNNKDFDTLKARCVDLCVACGSCTYACPAKRPVSQTMGLAKGWYMAELRKGGK